MKNKRTTPGSRRRSGLPEYLLIPLLFLVISIQIAVYWWYLSREDAPGASLRETVVTTADAPADTTGAPETTVPEATEDPVLLQARLILEDMTEREKICQLFIVTQEEITGASPVTRSGEASRKAIEEQPVGGIIYFSQNLVSRDQCSAMIDNLQSYSKLGLFIAVDEEGGIVSRLGSRESMGVTHFPAMGKIGDSERTEDAYEVGRTLGDELAELGFNLDFAPVADVNSNEDNPVIGSRAFHSDPQIAADMVAACVRGFADSGTLCTLKHFPGHGDTGTDSHYGIARSGKTLEELYECELIPFRAGIDAGAPVIMTGHITLPEVTGSDVPATLSHEIITQLLREELGFDGLIITDSMIMQAITDRYSASTAAVMAIQAGVDMILMPESLSDAVAGIEEALDSGELTMERIDECVLRILETKLRRGIIAMP